MSKIFLLEDDELIGTQIKIVLERAGHTVSWLKEGIEASEQLKLFDFDLIILDRAVPGINGLDVLKNYRMNAGSAPVLILTALSSPIDTSLGLDAGADDYLGKPFSLIELEARVRALLRRRPQLAHEVLKCDSLTLDTRTCRFYKGSREVFLLPKEFALMEFFMRHPGFVFSAEEILEKVWSNESESSEHAVQQCILRLRKKLEDEGDDAGAARLLVTVKGLGYKLVAKS
ncbi:MAG: response regulator transcription factor [Candidatus Obscuribacterales bacterium]|nr:response regulator transcription factor [Candidatus Obscuribacterales bacterium]